MSVPDLAPDDDEGVVCVCGGGGGGVDFEHRDETSETSEIVVTRSGGLPVSSCNRWTKLYN